jgi:hypothetical protein
MNAITLSHEAMKQALEALEHAEKDVADSQRLNTDQVDEAITALRQALEADEKPCACCGDGNARLSVTRICDTCGSEYSSQAEFDLAIRLQAEREAAYKRRGVWMFNPYSGDPRHPGDIASDPHGILLVDPEQPLSERGRP